MEPKEQVIDRLTSNLKLLGDVEIPYFSKVKPLLYNLFVIETGPVCMLLAHYYATGKPTNEDFLRDPAKQIDWCIRQLPYISKVAHKSREIRNKLVHGDILFLKLIKETVNAYISFYRKSSQIVCLITMILEQLSIITDIMLGNISEETTCCPLCRRPFEGKIDISIEKEPQSKPIEESLLLLMDDEKQEAKTLRYLKDNGYKEKLKGSKIKILTGMYAGNEAIFRSWSGTVAYVEIENIGRKGLSIDFITIKIIAGNNF